MQEIKEVVSEAIYDYRLGKCPKCGGTKYIIKAFTPFYLEVDSSDVNSLFVSEFDDGQLEMVARCKKCKSEKIIL